MSDTDQIQNVEKLGDLVTAVRLERSRMPKRLKQIADALIATPDDFIVLNSKAVAEKLGVSPSALVRFAQSFGFAGYTEMQEVLRRDRMRGQSSYRQRAAAEARDTGSEQHRDMAHVFEAIVDANRTALEGLANDVAHPVLAAFVERIRTASMVGIVAQRRALLVAQYLYYGLARSETATLLIDGAGGMLSEQVQPLGPRDVLVAISFAPYAAATLDAVRIARSRGVEVLAITDKPDSPLLEMAHEALVLDEGDYSNIRSIASSITLVQVIFVAIGLNIPTG